MEMFPVWSHPGTFWLETHSNWCGCRSNFVQIKLYSKQGSGGCKMPHYFTRVCYHYWPPGLLEHCFKVSTLPESNHTARPSLCTLGLFCLNCVSVTEVLLDCVQCYSFSLFVHQMYILLFFELLSACCICCFSLW